MGTERDFAEAMQELRQHELADGPGGPAREACEWWEKTFGEKVKQWRKQRSWSQEDLSGELAILGFEFHQTTVAKIERGARPLRVAEAVAIAMAFRVPVLSVFYGPGPESEPMSIRMMRESLEKVEAGIAETQANLQAIAGLLADQETSRAHLAKALNQAAVAAEHDDSTP